MSFIRIFFFAVIALGIGQSAQAEKEFTFEDLKQLVQSKDLRTIEDVLPLLPEDLKTNFTFMHQSRSIQHSSAEAPRALLFGKTAKLVLGFNGDANDAGHDRLEVMQFDDKTDRFKFAFIYFADRDTKAEVIDSPMNCIGCHGMMAQDLRPNWDVGLVWRGAYGSQDDSFAATQLDPNLKVEAENYAHFLKSASSHERYKHLDFSKPLDTSSRHEVENRPNLLLGLLLTRLQVKRIARQIETADGFKALEASILSKLIGCEQVEVDPKFRADVEARLKSFLTPIYGPQMVQEFLRDQVPGSLDAFSIGKDLNLNLMEWPLTAEKRTYAIFDGSFTFKELLAAEMMSRMAKRNPQFRAYTDTVGLADSPLSLGVTAGSVAVDRLGGKLAPTAVGACSLLKVSQLN